MVTNGKVEKTIDVEANKKDKDDGNMTSNEWVTKSFGAILPTHDTDQSASPAKRHDLDQYAQNKEKEVEDKEVSIGEQSGRDNYQKDVINGDYEEEDKNSPGNYLGTCGSAKQQGFNKIQELVESRDARDKEEPENQSFMDSTFEIDNDISRGKCLHVDGNNDENEFNSNIVSNTSKQKFDSELQLQTNEHEQHNNNKEIAQIHSGRQNEETLVVMVNTESPNKVLHDILTHKQ
ncbi:hypothetical protein MTR67_031902 [Solanum verrucosum]|uniref:Uncharacterized protein n=1 Tax=Solanum verrucosum TaxID=315347 RepID=A0AAF0U3F5_SOLVR|nr:hypothetical protein MTR67_031902 [Solanum verrucosum]